MDPNSDSPTGEETISEMGKTSPSTPPESAPQGPDALEEAGRSLAELSAYLSLYLQAQLDRAKLSARNVFLGISIHSLTILLIAGILLLGLSFLSFGLAGGLNEILGSRPWVGYLLTGTFWILLFLGLASYFLMGRRRRVFKKKLKNYEQELEAQRLRFGRSATDQAVRAAQE